MGRNRLQDKVTVVTGASSGLGRGIAKACAAEGAKLVVSDINEQPNVCGFEDDATLSTVQSIREAGGEAVFVRCDVTESIPLKRWGEVEDVANLAVFLASDESTHIHGDLIKVDGGEILSRYSV